MTDAGLAGEVALLVTELVERLAELLAKPVADPTAGTMSHHKVSDRLAPWHAEAGPILMDIHEGAHSLEASLRRAPRRAPRWVRRQHHKGPRFDRPPRSRRAREGCPPYDPHPVRLDSPGRRG